MHVHWPHYWHYDFFNSLRMIARAGMLDDPRADEAKDILRSRQRGDRTWRVSGHCYWRKETEAVFWGDAHHIVTAGALAVLQ
jgi:hypothetical protein